MNALPDIQPGDIAFHRNGDLGCVIMPPSEKDTRIRVVFFLDEDTEELELMEMPWELRALDHVERDEVVVWGRGLEVQMELWDEVA